MNVKYYTCYPTVKKFHKWGGTVHSVRPMDPRPQDTDAFYRYFMDYGGELDNATRCYTTHNVY
jgi:hypothetical protein